MGRKHEMLRRCAQVRDLIQEKKYVQALKAMDEIPLAEVAALEDLYLFADMYERAERLDKKKEIFFLIYERTHSRYILNRLLRLVIRMGDMNEARELFLAYEFAGNITLDTFELRYLLAKAEGESRATLINILEDLKREEYTEEWGYQLARLYEQEGMREKCIQECKDLKLWFGEGRIIEMAGELQKRCEAPDWEPPNEEEIPEPEEPDLEMRLAYAAPPIGILDMESETETVLGLDDVLGSDDIPEPDVDTDGVGQKEEMPGKDILPEVLETESTAWEETGSGDPVSVDAASSFGGEYVSEPVVVKKEKPKDAPKRGPLSEQEELPEDEHEHISEHGITYRTLKSTIAHVRRDRQHAHFVFAGGEERITLAVAKRITKELNHVGYLSARSIMKITADKLNELELSNQIDKLAGGCMLVTNAPEMAEKTAGDLLSLIKENGDKIVVMLSGPFDELDCFLSIYPELSEELIYKVHM